MMERADLSLQRERKKEGKNEFIPAKGAQKGRKRAALPVTGVLGGGQGAGRLTGGIVRRGAFPAGIAEECD